MYVHFSTLLLVQMSCTSSFAPVLRLPPIFWLFLRVSAQALLAGCLQAVEGALPLRSLHVLSVSSALLPQIHTAIKAAEPGLGGAGIHAGRHCEHHGAHDDDNVDEPLSLLHLADVAPRHEHDALAFPRWMIL